MTNSIASYIAACTIKIHMAKPDSFINILAKVL